MNPVSTEPTSLVFWSVAAFLLLLVVARLARAAWRPPATDPVAAQRVYEAQRSALARAGAAGEVAPEQLPALEQELARATLDDADRGAAQVKPVSRIERLALTLLVAVIVPAIAIPVYLRYGSPAPPAAGEAPAHHMSPADMVAELEKRIAVAPDDPEPQLWLARVHMSTGDYAKAVQAFEAVNRLMPEQAPILLQWADALSMQAEGHIDERATALIQQALALEPDNVTGLWLAGVAAEQAGKPDAALGYLQRAREASLAAGLPVAEIEAQLSELAARTGQALPALQEGVPAPASLTLEVTLDPALVADLPPETTVFVLAKAVAGPPMPLAVTRFPLSALPKTVTLDDSMAMAPQLKLSSAKEVMVTARISRSGDAVAKSGDLEGSLGPVEPRGAGILKLRIDRVVP